MSGYNPAADLCDNLQVYSEYYNSRASVASLRKMDVPMIPALYTDDNRMYDPLTPLAQSSGMLPPLEAPDEPVESLQFTQEGYHQPQVGEWELYGLVNNRLKAQARRYPHPISNEMEIVT